MASLPMAVELFDVVLETSAPLPTAVLENPVVLDDSAFTPSAVLLATEPAPRPIVSVLIVESDAIVTALAEKFPDASRKTIVEAVFALVAFDVTVNVAALDWFAVNVWEPDNPLPETFIVNVPLFTLLAVVAVAALPVMLMPQVPLAFVPVVLGAPTVL
jgi:hypothetical protein